MGDKDSSVIKKSANLHKEGGGCRQISMAALLNYDDAKPNLSKLFSSLQK